MPKFYAVRIGRIPGVYNTWEECQRQVIGFSGCQYKSFSELSNALSYVKGDPVPPTPQTSPLITHSLSSKSHSLSSMSMPNLKLSDIKVDSMNSHATLTNDCINVYTDGSCRDGKGGYGVVFVGEDSTKDVTLSGPVTTCEEGVCTNNIAELYAIETALRRVHNPNGKKVIIYTDSKYCIDSLTKWIYTWERNGWKTSTGGDVLNSDRIKTIRKLIKELPFPVELRHVRGHQGDTYNEMADMLADQGRQS